MTNYRRDYNEASLDAMLASLFCPPIQLKAEPPGLDEPLPEKSAKRTFSCCIWFRVENKQ